MQADAPKVVAIEQEPRHRPGLPGGHGPDSRRADSTRRRDPLSHPRHRDPLRPHLGVTHRYPDPGQGVAGVNPATARASNGSGRDRYLLCDPAGHAPGQECRRPALPADRHHQRRDTRAVSATSAAGRTVHSSPWYSATELTIAPHAGSEWATASAPTIVVLPGTGRLRVERDGETTPLVAPGAWAFSKRANVTASPIRVSARPPSCWSRPTSKTGGQADRRTDGPEGGLTDGDGREVPAAGRTLGIRDRPHSRKHLRPYTASADSADFTD